jgi:hypothetical protein
MNVSIKKADAKEQIVYGMVYAPDLLDMQGDMMTAEDIRKMAHEYMRDVNLRKSIDTQHDEVAADAYPVESFIASEGDPMWIPGAWVLGVKIEDPDLWLKVEKGEINGFSFSGKATASTVLVEYEYFPTVFGVTAPAEDGHTHTFVVKLDEDGKPIFGITSAAPDGHVHDIVRGTATNESSGHKHRIDIKNI